MMLPLTCRRCFVLSVIVAVLLLAAAGHAQISAGGTPVSFTWSLGGAVPVVQLPPPDIAALLAEDAQAPKDSPYRFGAPVEVHYTLANAGEWTELADGGRVWRLRIVSPGAYSINILYDRFFMPPGATLFLYNDERDQVIGAFTEANHWIDGTFLTQPLAGDAVTLEYHEPAAVRGQGELSIFRVVHAYRNLFGRARTLDDYGDSGWCNNNVNCPEGEPWQNEKRGVAMIMDGGYRICTGALINNTANNFVPYFLTANHCLGGETQWMFVFNYESPGCPNQNGPLNQTVSNAIRRANNAASDFALLELSAPVPLSYNPYFCGWSRVDSPATNSTCIHHPEGDIKKITFDYNAPAHGGWSGTPANSHWHIQAWDDGTTEPGSSGSPLFDQNHRITGQLHGGQASCSNNINDYYGKFSLSWDYGTSASRRLRDWLDPLNTGVTVLDGADPNASGRAAGTVTEPPGLALAGVRVRTLTTSHETTTDGSGYYSLGLPSGTYTLEFTKFGYHRVLVESVTVAFMETTWVNVVMNPVTDGVLLVRVLTQTGLPLEGARAVIAGAPLDTLVSDANGEFSATLPATDYAVRFWFTVQLTPPVTISLDTTLTVRAGDTTVAVLTLTVPRTEPTAADAYGYRAYDRYDSSYPASGEWMEISPMYGGPGSEFVFPAADSAAFLAAPFPVRFYGVDYDSLTVSENGWLLPGVHHVAGETNTSIPGNASNDPSGIIAPLWDDLLGGLGNEQFAWHDSARGCWILEFVHQRLVSPPNFLHNWQVHVLDPVFYPTLHGDCELVFVYGRVDYPTSCTVGIENPAENTGVQVLHNGTLNSTSWPIERGAVLRFTTGRGSGFGSVRVTLQLYPPPPNTNGIVVHFAGREITASPGGYFEQDSIPAVSACGLVEAPGYERTRQCDMTIQAGMMNEETFEAWRLDPPAALFATQFNGAVTLVWHRPVSVAFHANPDVRYEVYRDGARVAAGLRDTTFTDNPLPDGQMVSYRVRADYRFGSSPLSSALQIEIDLAVNETGSALPAELVLHPCFPNPFNPATRVRFDLPRAGQVTLRVFNLTGQLAATLVNASLPAGRHEVAWDAHSLPSGCYLVALEADGGHFVQKVALLK